MVASWGAPFRRHFGVILRSLWGVVLKGVLRAASQVLGAVLRAAFLLLLCSGGLDQGEGVADAPAHAPADAPAPAHAQKMQNCKCMTIKTAV